MPKKYNFNVTSKSLSNSGLCILGLRVLYWAHTYSDVNVPSSYFTRRLYNYGCQGEVRDELVRNLVDSKLIRRSDAIRVSAGRPAIFYSITSKGRRLLNQAREF